MVNGEAAAACLGKIRFEDAAHARKAARRKKGRIHYQCTHCNKWHVGHHTKDKRPRP